MPFSLDQVKQIGSLKGRKVTVLGLGLENSQLVPILIKEGAQVTVVDQRERHDLKERLELIKNFKTEIICGAGYLKGLSGAEIIFISPGVPRALKELKKAAKESLIISPLEFFLLRFKGISVGVTGTKGKSTTTSLIYHILKKAGRKVVLGGNIGEAPFLALGKEQSKSIAVLEFSSFQLEQIRLSPKISVVLEISQDHLAPLSPKNPNFHSSVRSYRLAKRRIIEFQDRSSLAVLNFDSRVVSGWKKHVKGKSLFFSARRRNFKNGVDIEEGAFFFKKAGRRYKIADIKESPLYGRHNLLNVAAAIAASLSLGVKREIIKEGIETFKPLSHRLEKVVSKNGILYVDDSAGTNPETAKAAIKSFSEPIWLIAGGSSKGADFTSLVKVILASDVRGVAGIGEEGRRIISALEQEKFTGFVKYTGSLERAVEYLAKKARPGDVVLLSPACASFDQFKSASERGEKFKQIVEHGI